MLKLDMGYVIVALKTFISFIGAIPRRYAMTHIAKDALLEKVRRIGSLATVGVLPQPTCRVRTAPRLRVVKKWWT